MAKSRLHDVARQGRDAVLERAGEVAGGMSEQLSAGGKLREFAASARQQIVDVAADAQQASAAKLEQAMADVQAALPLFREAGYVLEGLRIALGLAPQLQADFIADGVIVSDEQVDAMLAAHAERELTVLLIRAMRHASKLQEKLSFGGLRPGGLSVTVGIPPQVVVKFCPIARRETTSDAMLTS